MSKITKAAFLGGVATITLMQGWAGILVGEQLTTVMLNSADNGTARPVAAYECITWSLKAGKTIRYELVEKGTTGCKAPAFWEVL